MAESPTNFVSYADYLGLNGEEQRRLDEEAFQRAQADEDGAGQALQTATTDARALGVGLQQVGSYSDYVKAAKAAKEQYAAIKAAQTSANPFQAALSQGSSKDIADSAGTAFDDTEAQAQYQTGNVDRQNQYAAAQRDAQRKQGEEDAYRERRRKQYADEDSAYEKERAGYTADFQDTANFYGKYGRSGDPFISLDARRKRQLAQREADANGGR